MLRFLTITALAAAAAAQAPSGRVIGFAASTTSPGTPPVLMSQDLCDPAHRLCPAIGDPVAPYAGGVAYDGARGALWYTQGTRLVETQLADCQTSCTLPAATTLGPGAVASGLTIDEARRTLYQLETVPGLAALHEWSILGCPPRLGSVCRIPLPTARHVAGAVALDKRGGFVFYATSTFGAVTGPSNIVLVASLAAPCNILCQFTVDACGPSTRLGPITGMAHDCCANVLYATDGARTVELHRTGTRPCDWQVFACCPNAPSNLEWFGIDVEPGHPRELGRSCAGLGCPDCNAMRLSAVGDPVIGNQMFGFRIDDGPAGGLGFLAFNVGGCVPQGVPFLCGPLYPAAVPPLAITTMGPLVGVGCAGTVALPVPVPLDYGLCGGEMCFQGIVLCRTGGAIAGISLTNGVQVTVDG